MYTYICYIYIYIYICIHIFKGYFVAGLSSYTPEGATASLGFVNDAKIEDAKTNTLLVVLFIDVNMCIYVYIHICIQRERERDH